MPHNSTGYTPAPIDTEGVELFADVIALTEQLAEHAYDIWAMQKMSDVREKTRRRSVPGKR